MLRYFFYLAWNWSLRLAWFIIKHEIRGEKKYAIHTVGIDELKGKLSPEQRKHASIYQPINYYTAETLFEELFLEDIEGSLLDLGCGKGRVFAIGAAYGFKKMIGVEFVESLCADATAIAKMLIQKEKEVSIEVVCGDAGSYAIPASVTTIFLFNPFDNAIMQKVVKNMDESQRQHPRPLKILYANPVCKKLLQDAGFIETFYFKELDYIEGSVLERDP